jgi:hypothetical protein
MVIEEDSPKRFFYELNRLPFCYLFAIMKFLLQTFPKSLFSF